MDLRDQAARTATAGFVLSRLLMEPPSQALAENFAAPGMRETWPLRDPVSAAALERLEPDPYEALPRDHTTLFRRRPPLVAVHESAWRTDVDRAALGDSIAVSGCCLTVVASGEGEFEVELSSETLAKTAPRWEEGRGVNLERALRVSDRLGGHIVSGHVDGVGEVLEVSAEPGAYVMRLRAPEHLAPHLVPKGSVTVDGAVAGEDVRLPPGASSDRLVPAVAR